MNRYAAELLANPGAAVGECPVADGLEGLFWVDIPAGIIWRTDIASGRSVRHGDSRPIGAVGRRASGGLVFAAGGSLYGLQKFGGTAIEIARAFEDAGLQFNDGKADPWGRFVAGGACVDGSRARAALHAVNCDRSVVQLVTGVTMSNGLDWTTDRRRFYYVDTPTQRIDVFDVDPETGTLSGRRPFVEIPSKLGLPDGLTVDTEDCVWLAVWGGSAVLRFAPDGRQVAHVELPVSCPTSCTFGGDDRATLLITTAACYDGKGPAEPNGGAVFAASVAAAGQPARAFRG
jgi:sugar lactone lactonase YvrE